MLKNAGIINAQLRSLTVRLGHQGLLAVVDAGFCIPLGAEVVDLALVPGVPNMVQTISALVNELAIEQVYLSQRILVNAPELDSQYKELWDKKTKISYISAEDFKLKISEVKGFVRTGAYGFHSPNVILQGGCVYD